MFSNNYCTGRNVYYWCGTVKLNRSLREALRIHPLSKIQNCMAFLALNSKCGPSLNILLIILMRSLSLKSASNALRKIYNIKYIFMLIQYLHF